MATALLEILQKKPKVKIQQGLNVSFDQGKLLIEDDKLVDKTDTEFDAKTFRQRVLRRSFIEQVPTKMEAAKMEEEKLIKTIMGKDKTPLSSTDKPEKLKKMTMPGQKTEKIRVPRKQKEPEERILQIPAGMVEIDDRPISDRLIAKEPSINIKAPAYYMNNRELFINFINSLFEPYVLSNFVSAV